jgi:hypothetical protein
LATLRVEELKKVDEEEPPLHAGLPLAEPDVLDPARLGGSPQELLVHLQCRGRLAQCEAGTTLERSGETIGDRRIARARFSHGEPSGGGSA